MEPGDTLRDVVQRIDARVAGVAAEAAEGARHPLSAERATHRGRPREGRRGQKQQRGVKREEGRDAPGQRAGRDAVTPRRGHRLRVEEDDTGASVELWCAVNVRAAQQSKALSDSALVVVLFLS